MAKITKLRDLKPDPKNLNKGTERGTGMLEQSLREYGAGRSVLCDKNGVIIAGNKTVEQAAAIGLDKVVVVPTDGRQIVVVQRTDLDLAKDAKAKGLALADNRIAEVNLDWDAAALASLDAELLDGFFLEDELTRILKSECADSGAESQVDPRENLWDDLLDAADDHVKNTKQKTASLKRLSAAVFAVRDSYARKARKA